MIGVRKIAHATYEVPDLDAADRVLHGYSRPDAVGEGKGRRLSCLNRRSSLGRPAQGCTGQVHADRISDRADDDLDAFEKQTAGHGIKTAAQEGSRAVDRGHGESSRIRRAP